MPPARKSTRSSLRKSAAFKEPAALKKLNQSLEAAQKALTELRQHAGGKSSKSLHTGVGKFVSSAKRDSGKLTAVHYQFPPWFTNRPSARELLLAARERHPDDIVAIEFRHRSWFEHGAWPETAHGGYDGLVGG